MKSTVKPSKVSESSSGLKEEILASIDFHSKGIPLLVSSQILRSREMGQIDLGRIKKDEVGWVIEVLEVKSSLLGEEMLLRGQRKRLCASMNFLSGIFGSRVKFLLSSELDSF